MFLLLFIILASYAPMSSSRGLTKEFASHLFSPHTVRHPATTGSAVKAAMEPKKAHIFFSPAAKPDRSCDVRSTSCSSCACGCGSKVRLHQVEACAQWSEFKLRSPPIWLLLEVGSMLLKTLLEIIVPILSSCCWFFEQSESVLVLPKSCSERLML